MVLSGLRSGSANERFDRFNQPARRVYRFAHEEALRLDHAATGPEHPLLGLLREGEGPDARALTDVAVDLDHARVTVEARLGLGQPSPYDRGLTSPAQRIIDLAVKEANQLGQREVGPEHLLLGMLAARNEGFADLLAWLGTSDAAVLTALLCRLGRAG